MLGHMIDHMTCIHPQVWGACLVYRARRVIQAMMLMRWAWQVKWYEFRGHPYWSSLDPTVLTTPSTGVYWRGQRCVTMDTYMYMVYELMHNIWRLFTCNYYVLCWPHTLYPSHSRTLVTRWIPRNPYQNLPRPPPSPGLYWWGLAVILPGQYSEG